MLLSAQEISMAKNIYTSPRVASAAGKVLRDKTASAIEKELAVGDLVQSRPKKKLNKYGQKRKNGSA
jgi:hypothetical protein